MIKGINACYKGALPATDLQRISSWSLRTDKIAIRAAVDTVDQAFQIKVACSAFPNIKVMYLVEKPNHDLVVQLANRILDENSAIELLNEPNLNLIHPEDCHDFILDSHSILMASNFKGDILAGAVCDLRPRSTDYLKAANVKDWPENIIVSYHRYPQVQSNVLASQIGLTRNEEFSIFLKTIGNHDYACTEHGFHYETVRPYWFWPFYTRPAIDEYSAASEYTIDMNKLIIQANRYAILYQYTDGQKDDGEDRFGVKKMDGTYRQIEKSIISWR